MRVASPLTPRKWDMDAVASTSFGHGMNVTPLALAGAYGTLLNGGATIPLTIRKLRAGAKVDGPRVFSEATSAEMLKIMRSNVADPIGSGGKADAPGLSVGGKTGTGEKYDPAIRAYSTTKQVSSFAAVFPTEGPVEADRYFVLILLDEPHPAPSPTASRPAAGSPRRPAGRVIDRIAPYLGVPRTRPKPVTIAAAPERRTGGGL
jgi:cell division protein FtsI (penicillin-binding protein 3)